MTATVTRPDVDLEAWLAGEVERPCEIHHGGSPETCGDLAEWLMLVKACCGRTSALTCDYHHASIVAAGLKCHWCHRFMRVTWTERIRSPR